MDNVNTLTDQATDYTTRALLCTVQNSNIIKTLIIESAL